MLEQMHVERFFFLLSLSLLCCASQTGEALPSLGEISGHPIVGGLKLHTCAHGVGILFGLGNIFFNMMALHFLKMKMKPTGEVWIVFMSVSHIRNHFITFLCIIKCAVVAKMCVSLSLSLSL